MVDTKITFTNIINQDNVNLRRWELITKEALKLLVLSKHPQRLDYRGFEKNDYR